MSAMNNLRIFGTLCIRSLFVAFLECLVFSYVMDFKFLWQGYCTFLQIQWSGSPQGRPESGEICQWYECFSIVKYEARVRIY